jgi:hypothetical protein
LYTPVAFVDLSDGKQLARVQAYFPFGKKKEFGGFAFTFADGTQVLIGERPDIGNDSDSIQFSADGNEVIRGLYWYFGSKRSHGGNPSKLRGIQVRYLEPLPTCFLYLPASILFHNVFND